VSSSVRSRLMSRRRFLPGWLGFALGAAALWLLGPVRANAESPPPAPVPAPAQVCSGCHAEATASWAGTIHRRTAGAPQLAESQQGCAACHKGTADHLADVSDESKQPKLGKLTGDQVTDLCQSCHRGGKQMLWKLSAHSRSKDSCLTCHDPHRGKGEHMLKEREPDLCAKCHPGQVADGNLPSHHPIKEGKMTCTDCHNVHGDERGNLPEASNGEMCFRCHAEKAGPFQAEHPPVTEDCTICHRPHGSPVNNLLVMDQPVLCLQCHAGHSDSHRSPLVGTSPDAPAALTAINGFYGKCTSCHSRIHGTDLMSQTGNPTFMPGSPLTSEAAAGRSFSASASEAAWGFSDVELGQSDASGNQANVREYDGRNNDFLNGSLGLTKLGTEDDLHLEVIDLGWGDQDIRLRYGNPLFDMKLHTSGLTHRLGRYDDFTDVLIPTSGGGTLRVNATDQAEGYNGYHLDRTLVDLQLAARCPQVPQAKWLLNMWQEREHGSRQFLFLDRCTSCHKVQTSEPIDRVTTITEGGVQVDLPKASLRYLHGTQEFSNRASEEFFNFTGVFGLYNGLAPLFGVANTHTTTNDLRGAASVGKHASLAGLWRTKDRTDELGDGHLSVRSAGGGASYRLSPKLSLQGSHFAHTFDVTNIEEGVSRDRGTTRLDLRYTGLPNAVWSLGYTKEKVSRESERTFVPASSDSNIWTSAFTYQPQSRLFLQLRYRGTHTDNHDFFSLDEVPVSFSSRLLGLPNDGSMFSGVASYALAPNTMLSGLYTRRKDDYNVDVASLDVSRFDHLATTTKGAQLVRTQGRSQLTASYYHQDGDSLTDATYGNDIFTLSPPLSGADTLFPPINSLAAFRYKASVLSLDGSQWVTRRWRVFGRYDRTTTQGEVTAYDLGDYIDQNPDLNGVDVLLNPFDIDIRDLWLGVSFLVDPDTEVALSHQRRTWNDVANPSADGAYSFWRIGLRRRF
jgi:DmsE family decaheme c-type cytochrome